MVDTAPSRLDGGGAFAADLVRELAVLEPLVVKPELQEYVRSRAPELVLEIFRTLRRATDVSRLNIATRPRAQCRGPRRGDRSLRAPLDRAVRSGWNTQHRKL